MKKNYRVKKNRLTLQTLNLENNKVMYAIVEIGGKQYKAETGKKLFVDRLEGNIGDDLTFDKVLLVEMDGATKVGTPTTGTSVIAKLEKQVKADKVIVFKKKRRKGYRVKNGHRQSFTQISITSI